MKKTTQWIYASLNGLTPAERVKRKGKEFPNPFSLAELFHENSKYHPDLMSSQMPLHQYATPDYAAMRREEYVNLPSLKELPSLSAPLGEVLRQRRSELDFALPVTFEQLAQILQHAWGVSAHKPVQDHDGSTFDLRLRTYPSGGALYPIQMIILCTTSGRAGVWLISIFSF